MMIHTFMEIQPSTLEIDDMQILTTSAKQGFIAMHLSLLAILVDKPMHDVHSLSVTLEWRSRSVYRIASKFRGVKFLWFLHILTGSKRNNHFCVESIFGKLVGNMFCAFWYAYSDSPNLAECSCAIFNHISGNTLTCIRLKCRGLQYLGS